MSIVSSGFAEAAAGQAATLGMPELRFVVVEHPIQGRSDDEMRALADRAYHEVLAALGGEASSTAA